MTMQSRVNKQTKKDKQMSDNNETTLLRDAAWLATQPPDALVLVYDPEVGYWLGPGMGYTQNYSEAYPWYVSGIPKGVRHRMSYRLPESAILPEGRKCRIEQVLTAPLIELVRTAPVNEVVRTQVHAQVLLPIPAEHVTFEAIKQWVETTIDPKVAVPQRLGGLSIPQVHQAAANPGELTMLVEYSEVEYGSCHYSVSRYGSNDYTLNAEEMAELVAEADGSLDRLHGMVREALANACMEDRPDTEVSEDGYDYNDHESDNTEDESASVNPRALRDRINQWLTVNAPNFGGATAPVPEDEPAF
jgi:hypothetical protein